MIYTESFDRLPGPVKQYVTGRLYAILTEDDDDETFAHLSTGDRRAILEILTETKPGLWPK